MSILSKFKIQDKSIFCNNGEVVKAIEFKVEKIASLDFEIIDSSDNEINVSDYNEIVFRSAINNPLANKTFKDVLRNYYYGMFYDGVVYVFVFEKGFYIAREYEVRKSYKHPITLKGVNAPIIFSKKIINRNVVTGKCQPQYELIKNEIAEKYYSQMLNVELLDKGLVVREIISTEDEITQEAADQLKKKFSNLWGLKNKITNFSNEGSTLVLQGKWDYKNISTSLADINNTSIANKNRDYIYNFLGVPPQLMGSDSTSTYSNYQEAMRNFLTMTIIPEAKNLYNLINNELLINKEFKIALDLSNMINFIEEKEKNFNMLHQLYLEGLISPEDFKKGAGFGEYETPLDFEEKGGDEIE